MRTVAPQNTVSTLLHLFAARSPLTVIPRVRRERTSLTLTLSLIILTDSNENVLYDLRQRKGKDLQSRKFLESVEILLWLSDRQLRCLGCGSITEFVREFFRLALSSCVR